MNFDQEFATVNLILDTDFETRGVDAFALSLIKVEKQMRRIFTYLIFQNPSFDERHILELRNTLASNKQIYFEGFIDGFNFISTKTIRQVYGHKYIDDLTEIKNYTKDRNKIFHGQITANGLSREELILRVNHIKNWCQNLSEKIEIEIGYNGFGDSFHKSKSDLVINNIIEFNSIEKYSTLLRNILQR